VYDTWSGWVVAAVDAPGHACAHDGHEANRVLWKRSRRSLEVAVREQFNRSKTA
jgi:hypothetical protein